MYLHKVHRVYSPQEVATNAMRYLYKLPSGKVWPLEAAKTLCLCKAHAILIVRQNVEVPAPDHEFYRWNSLKMRLFTEIAGASGWVVLYVHWHDAFSLPATQRKHRSSPRRTEQSVE